MAKTPVDVSEFEKVREQIIQEENGPDWKLAKSFEHTNAYRKTNNDSIFKVRACNTFVQVLTLNVLHLKFVSNIIGVPLEDCKLFGQSYFVGFNI